MTFGMKLKMLRVKHRLSQEAMCRRLLLSQPVYSRYENDARQGEENAALVLRVVETFKVSKEWLLYGGEEGFLPGAGSIDVPPGVAAEFANMLLKQHELNEQILKILLKK